MGKNKLAYNLIMFLYETNPTDWKEIPLSIRPSQKDFVLTRGDFTYKVKQRNVYIKISLFYFLWKRIS